MSAFGRARQAVTGARRLGARGVMNRATRTLLRATSSPMEDIGLSRDDLIAQPRSEHLRLTSSTPQVTIIMTPPGRDSGGHLTIMRLADRLQRSGVATHLAILDIRGGSARRHATRLREYFPSLVADSTLVVSDARQGIPDSETLLATSWQTAYVLARSTAAGRRTYLIQDFEPWFYPQGDGFSLARSTYDLGFRGLTIGGTLAGVITRRTGMHCESFPFGCDIPPVDTTTAHGLQQRITCYARPGTPRRGFILAMSALEHFQRLRPDVRIDIVGGAGRWPGVRAHWHGIVPPERMAELYRLSDAGLCLSFTNVSLVPFEMLASGCPVVVNDTAFSRGELTSHCVRHCPPDPRSLAAALSAEIAGASPAKRLRAQASPCVRPWQDTADEAVAVLRSQITNDLSRGGVPEATPQG